MAELAHISLTYYTKRERGRVPSVSAGVLDDLADAAPAHPAWLASVASSQVGLTLGSLVSGVVVQIVADARTVSYLVMVGLLVLRAQAPVTPHRPSRLDR